MKIQIRCALKWGKHNSRASFMWRLLSYYYDEDEDLRRMTIRPSECAEKMASTRGPSAAELLMGCGRFRDRAGAAAVERGLFRDGFVLVLCDPCRRLEDGSGARVWDESRPSLHKVNLPKPKPPSLGWPRSLTPQPLITSIQLRTISSSF